MGEEKIKVKINGKLIKFEKTIKIIDALKFVDIELPSPCRHEYLSNTSHCGLCIVGIKLIKSSNWQMKLACMEDVVDGMEIDTEYPQAVKLRETIINMYLLKHPLDCSLCDKVGNCFLHKFASHTKFRGFTRVVGKHYWQRDLKPLGDKISIDHVKCIFCGRCLKFCREILGEDILGKIKNENDIDEVRLYPGKECNNNYSLNLVDICPAGAIIENKRDTDYPEWNLKHTPSIAIESSVGINTYILHDKKHIYRIIPRKNDLINQIWMTDSARNFSNILDINSRITQVQRLRKLSDIRISLAYAVNKLLNNNKGTYVVCSGEMSLEDQFVLKRFLDITFATPYFVKRKGIGDNFLISDDPYPNTTGAIIMRLATEVNTHENLDDLYKYIQKGRCNNVICIYEDLFIDKVDSKIFDDVNIIYIGYKKNRTANIANFVFPVVTVFERTGTFVNKDFILQKFFKAVNPPGKGVLECWEVLSLLLNTYFRGVEDEYLTLQQIWHDLSYTVQIFNNINFKDIPLNGLILKKH